MKFEATEMMAYIQDIDSEYRQNMHSLNLFRSESLTKWNSKDIKLFAAQFYHIRGYFIHFMWYLANFIQDKQFKKIILDNIGEEIGINATLSHEQLYAQFAEYCGVDIQDEILNQTSYPTFAKQYNYEHIAWLQAHPETAQIAAFAAYERLDNIDYIFLYQLGQSLGLPPKVLTFFKVHTHVEHFGPVLPILENRWFEKKEEIKSGFQFIYNHQLSMWKNLSGSLISKVDIA